MVSVIAKNLKDRRQDKGKPSKEYNKSNYLKYNTIRMQRYKD